VFGADGEGRGGGLDAVVKAAGEGDDAHGAELVVAAGDAGDLEGGVCGGLGW
jgi:hypothetical protein